MTGKTFYITTPAYYVNDVLHIGHAYCTIAVDVIARFKRFAGYEVLFVTATDEHGQKIDEAAAAQGLKPIELADSIVRQDKAVWEKLNISYDDFIRTTEDRHVKAVSGIFQALYEKGDIYKGLYEGLYCIPCETFWTESQAEAGVCPDCGRSLKKVEEESYFFKLSKYRERLLKLYEENRSFMLPASRRAEMINIVKGDLRDLSVSRTAVKWGIPVPFDKSHTIYVWFDALINYISAAGYLNDEKKFSKFWPADVHVVGKEIYKFHVIIWPAMLMALGLEPPGCVFGHGWWTVNGQKMSKSKANVVDPVKTAGRFGVDVLRYFLFREVPFGTDGDFSQESLLSRYNTELANDLGNLLNRTLTMVEKYFEGRIPGYGEREKGFKAQVEECVKNTTGYYDSYQLSEALSQVMGLVGSSNRYIETSAPWKLSKEDPGRLGSVLYNLLEALRITALLISPFMPETAGSILRQLGIKESLSSLGISGLNWGGMKENGRINKGSPLFPRFEGKTK